MFEYLGKAYKKWTFPLGWGGGLETPDLPQNTKQGISLIINSDTLFQFLGGVTLLSLDPGPKGVPNL